MKHYDVLIVGGGPAGASCAAAIIQAGKSCLILDKADFSRQKPCAGWLTPRVFRDLDLEPSDYPFGLTKYSSLRVNIAGWPLLLPGTQYAIRRIEFDAWLLKRSRAEIIKFNVKDIQRKENVYIIDDKFSAEYLVGAGGTYCPVYRSLFKDHPGRTGSQIISLEVEYLEKRVDPSCRLWFFMDGLPGYAWYVPKTDDYLNIGIGANAAVLKERGSNIWDHWENHINHLVNLGLIDRRSYDPLGYTYYLRGEENTANIDNAYLVGDSMGLASLDMGEGIGPAIQSGIEAARSILDNRPYSLRDISKYSLLPRGLRWLIKAS